MIDRQALAAQVIVSAGNVLAAAGFTRAEICDFFRQAADQLDHRTTPQADPDRAPPPVSDGGLARVATEFARNSAVHELHGLAGRAGKLVPLADEGSDLRDAFDLAMQAVPLLAEAQHALRNMATRAGLPFVAHHDERDALSASGDHEGAARAICLEDFEAPYANVPALFAAVFDALAAREDREAFTFLLGQLVDNGVTLDPRAKAAIEKGGHALV
jgi:hypothetical protein